MLIDSIVILFVHINKLITFNEVVIFLLICFYLYACILCECLFMLNLMLSKVLDAMKTLCLSF
ncbi:hypothetical protein Lalb_Chr08g0243011 [Lupinus albus]|uniref:Uncharacterized protein n=1 Tax=Lupinus albus TaxID=3870 RepID=A0A6A4Q6T6_LUPAL|nr:hypothetical protein Lalb_Chr08g0243011 [Lupinus albus]